MDKFDAYELCVQSPRHLSMFLRALYPGSGTPPDALILREDFCGTAALSRRWVADARRRFGPDAPARAIAVDLDPAVLARAAKANQEAGLSGAITLLHADCITAPVRPSDTCDIIFVGNFSIGYIQDRRTLVDYLRRSRERLALGRMGFSSDTGLFACDTYTGPGAYALGGVTRTHMGRGREVVRYTWEQREADALTARVTSVLHFQIEIDGEITARFPDAFTYHWRLWTIPELREAMLEAGFASTEVHQDVSEHPSPLTHGRELSDSGIVCVVARL